MPTRYPVDKNRIRRLREARGMSMEGLALLSGISVNTIEKMESGALTSLSRDVAARLAQVFDLRETSFDAPITALKARATNLADILGTGMESPVQWVDVPLIGTVPAGELMLMEEVRGEESIPVHPAILNEVKRPFCLIVTGDSLSDDFILDGDIVIIDPDAPVKDGHQYVLRIEAAVTAKRIYRTRKSLRLEGAGYSLTVRENKVENLGRIVGVIRFGED